MSFAQMIRQARVHHHGLEAISVVVVQGSFTFLLFFDPHWFSGCLWRLSFENRFSCLSSKYENYTFKIFANHLSHDNICLMCVFIYQPNKLFLINVYLKSNHNNPNWFQSVFVFSFYIVIRNYWPREYYWWCIIRIVF